MKKHVMGLEYRESRISDPAFETACRMTQNDPTRVDNVYQILTTFIKRMAAQDDRNLDSEYSLRPAVHALDTEARACFVTMGGLVTEPELELV